MRISDYYIAEKLGIVGSVAKAASLGGYDPLSGYKPQGGSYVEYEKKIPRLATDLVGGVGDAIGRSLDSARKRRESAKSRKEAEARSKRSGAENLARQKELAKYRRKQAEKLAKYKAGLPSKQRERPGKTMMNGLKQGISKKTSSIGADIAKSDRKLLPPSRSTERGGAITKPTAPKALPPSGGVVKPVSVRDVTPPRKALPPARGPVQQVKVRDLGPSPKPQGGSPAPVKAQKPPKPSAKAQKAGKPDLDTLLKDIRSPSKPKAQAKPKPSAKPKKQKSPEGVEYSFESVFFESIDKMKYRSGNRVMKALVAAKEGRPVGLDSTTPPYWNNQSNKTYGVTSGS